jgi:hypothetical protein
MEAQESVCLIQIGTALRFPFAIAIRSILELIAHFVSFIFNLVICGAYGCNFSNMS